MRQLLVLDHKFTYISIHRNINFDYIHGYALGALILRLGWRRSGSDRPILCGDDDPVSFDSSVDEIPREAKSMLGKSAMSEEARAGATFLPWKVAASSRVFISA